MNTVNLELTEIRKAQAAQQYDMIVDLVSALNIPRTDKLKLRQQLKREFNFPVRDFDQVYASKTGFYIEKV